MFGKISSYIQVILMKKSLQKSGMKQKIINLKKNCILEEQE